MRVLAAPNAYKHALSAARAAAAMRRGILKSLPSARVDLLPLSDGGPGFLECLRAARGGRIFESEVLGPLTRPARARWLLTRDGVAVVESAQAVGLELVPRGQEDAPAAHSYGLGQLLRSAREKGCREALLGLGGSACSDGGTGMARALGWRFLDRRGLPLALGGGDLDRLHRALPPRRPALEGMRLTALVDVDNPLHGPRGAAMVFSPQKGAGPAEALRLEKGLRRLARLCGPGPASRPGAGAAGGLGFGVLAFLGGSLAPGAQTLLERTGFGKKLEACGLVLSGEGSLDRQSLSGKLPIQVALRAKRAGKPCVLLVGRADATLPWSRYGVTQVRKLQKQGMSLEQSLRLTVRRLEEECRLVARDYL